MDGMVEKSKILIVDDNPRNLYSFQTILGAPELDLLTAASGEEALRLLLDDPDVALILMDVQMPGMDGFETAGLIRGQPKFRDVPILFITAVYRDDAFARQGFEAGASDYITKPVDGDLLASKVNVFLTLQKQKKELEREIVERRRAQEQVRHLNAVLRAIRSVNRPMRTGEQEQLIQGVCKKLIATRGYQSAWAALTDRDGAAVMVAEAGWGEAFSPLAEMFERGELPRCGRRALKASSVVVIQAPLSTCADCPLAAACRGRHGMAARLERSGAVYGLLGVSLPADIVANEEEQSLFEEVASDISFALHGIEVEEARSRAEEELRKHRNHLEELVRERTAELRQMVNAMAGREVRMAELKQIIRKLRAQLEEAGLEPVAQDPLAADKEASDES